MLDADQHPDTVDGRVRVCLVNQTHDPFTNMCGICGCSSGESAGRSQKARRNLVLEPLLHEHDHGGHALLLDSAGRPHEHADDHNHDHTHAHDQNHDPDHSHSHSHDGHHHHHGPDETRVIELSRAILDKNDRLAERARGIFLGKGVTVLNLVSSPGSGKTTLLEKTITRLAGRVRSAIIVGDCATDNDARRLRRTGVTAVQVTTGNVCHLDAHMVLHALEGLKLSEIDLLFIENVGNLVCPSAFDLGEDQRIVLTSVTEGEDKPAKYPSIFHDADVVVLSKTDIAPAVDFNHEQAAAHIHDAAPGAKVFELSAKTGDGMDEWTAYLEQIVADKHVIAVA